MFRRDPVKTLKQSIRELEDQVPDLNEALFLLKAQATLAEGELKKAQGAERELVDKVAAAVNEDRHDIALNYATALAEVRREVERHAHELELASEAFRRAQRHKREFVVETERRIEEAKDALAARRAAEWSERVAQALHAVTRAGRRSGAGHDELVAALRARAAEGEEELVRALEDLGDASAAFEPVVARAFVDGLQRRLEGLEQQVAVTRRQLDALSRRLGEA